MAIQDFLKKLGFGKDKDADTPEHFINKGSSGTEIFSGYYNEEYLAKFLNMPEGIDIFDQMRRSDYQVQMLLSAVKNPIIAASWGVEPVDDSDEEMKIAEFVKFCLFDDIGYPDGSKSKSFREFVTEALTSIEFGYSLFEPIYKVVMDHPKWGNYIGLRDIGYRSQKTIYEWNLNQNGSINNVRQLAQGDLAVDVMISGENLMPITFKKEGDNYEGISMLRPLYGNWLRKDFYLKILAMGIERTATGVLVGKVPSSAQDDAEQMTFFKSMLQKFTSHQSTFMVIPTDFDLVVTKIDFDADGVEKAIDAEDKRMAKSFLAGFLELGLGGQAGSQSLGKDLSTIFLNGIEIYSETIGDAVEKEIVKKLVDSRFGKRQKYPQVKASDVNNKNGKERAEIAALLKGAGIIRDSDQLEDALNRDFDFPIISQEQKDRDKAEGKGRTTAAKNDNNPFDEPKEEVKEEPKKKPKEKKSLADVTKFAESDNASLFIRNRSKNIHTFMQTQLEGRTKLYLEKVAKQFKAETNVAKRRKILSDSEIPAKRDYKQKLRLEMAMLADEATRNVLKELKMEGIKFDEFNDILKTLPLALRDKLRSNIDQIVLDQDAELKKRMFFIASQKLDTTDSVESLIADMDKAAKSYTDTGVLSTVATNATSGTVNSARNAVYQTPEVFEEIESFVIVNPSPDAPICKELAGRVFTKEEYLTQDLPPYHHNCETTVRAQLTGQKNIKPVNPLGLTPTGTPDQVAKILKSKTFAEIIESEAQPEAAIESLAKTIDERNEEIKALKEDNAVNTDNLMKVLSGET